jgi:hypothetical protein
MAKLHRYMRVLGAASAQQTMLTGAVMCRIILEVDAMTIALRVTMRSEGGDIPLAEQTFSQALANAKEQLARSLLK